MNEREISPHQIINFKYYVLSFLLIITVIGAPIGIGLAFWKYLVTKNTKYIFTDERLKTKSGVFNKYFDEFEYYRIRDYSVTQPFFYRLFGCGTIVLHTSDRTDPTFTLEAIKNSEEVKELIRNLVERARKNKGVRDLEVQS